MECGSLLPLYKPRTYEKWSFPAQSARRVTQVKYSVSGMDISTG